MTSWTRSTARAVSWFFEQNESGQFHRYVRGHCDLPGDTRAVHHPGPLPITPDEVLCEILKEHRL